MRPFILLIGFLGFSSGQCPAADVSPDSGRGTGDQPSSAIVDFQRDIQPILLKACISCHDNSKHKGGLRLDSAGNALKGGNSGAVIKPGDGKNSRLIRLVSGLDPDLKMPPNGSALRDEEVGRLWAWIDQGAKWPTDVVLTAPSSAQSQTHWSYVPVQRPDIPQVSRPGSVRNPIDAFVWARLELEKITPAPEADRPTLIRRLCLDLLGLPPSPQEVDTFLSDSQPDAYERLVDRLLDSPHYGERWGRHWLDLARYADSDGYEKDTGRPHAWRYRQWVIEALNRDLPFNQFTVEQLAGDLLPNSTVDQKIATGFHRNTLTNREGGVDREQFRVEAVVDRVNTTSKVFLGVTIGCAQCHDHKFDPFSQQEYYKLFAFFNSDVEVDLPAPLESEKDVYAAKKTAHDQRLAELKKAVDVYTENELPANQQKWESELHLAQLRALPANITAILLVDPAKRPEAQKKEITGYYAKTDKKLTQLNKAVTDHQKTAPVQALAQTLALGPTRKTHLLVRGDFLRPGAAVEPGTPAILSPGNPETRKSRLDLARWIVDPVNPLTSRVIVNWMWHHYFGRGLVPTLEDFGVQGEKPSHPELLDFLASEFIARDWSMKSIHKLIVTSATYRQSSRVRPDLLVRDPLNILLARQNRLRLEAEVVRDLALASSGLLNPKISGPSVHPPQPAGISELTYAGSAKWAESTGGDRYRRGMYTWFQRTSPYPMLMTFDAPDSNTSCVRRDRSNTPLQALTLLNDTTFVECAQALGRRVVVEKPEVPLERIRYCFRLCLAREPSAAELSRLGKFFEELLQTCRDTPATNAQLQGKEKPAGVDTAEAAAWVALARTIMNLDEFVTRE